MKKLLKQNNMVFGIVLAIVFPLILFGVLYLTNNFIGKYHSNVNFVQSTTLQLMAIIANVIFLRYYLVKLKFDKTGRGILLVTFLYILAYFVNDYLIN